MTFQDCEYRYENNNQLYCKNKDDNGKCDNCKQNIHLNCDNYNPQKDLCLKWFETDVSKHQDTCSEKTRYDDKELSRKWSN